MPRDSPSNSEDPYKSQGEKQIARFLNIHGIDYYYEHPLAVIDRGNVRIWYPDFLLPQYGLIIEYAGVTGNKGYKVQLSHKKKVYEMMNLSAIFLEPKSFQGYWPKTLEKTIEVVLKTRLDDFRQKVKRKESARFSV